VTVVAKGFIVVSVTVGLVASDYCEAVTYKGAIAMCVTVGLVASDYCVAGVVERISFKDCARDLGCYGERMLCGRY
jgi:hypothetical protein